MLTASRENIESTRYCCGTFFNVGKIFHCDCGMIQSEQNCKCEEIVGFESDRGMKGRVCCKQIERISSSQYTLMACIRPVEV